MTEKQRTFLISYYSGRMSELTQKLLIPARSTATEKELARCIVIRDHLKNAM